MSVTLYGIPNCDTVKKARTWLDKVAQATAWEMTLNEIQRLELRLLRLEAEALIKGPAPAEKK